MPAKTPAPITYRDHIINRMRTDSGGLIEWKWWATIDGKQSTVTRLGVAGDGLDEIKRRINDYFQRLALHIAQGWRKSGDPRSLEETSPKGYLLK